MKLARFLPLLLALVAAGCGGGGHAGPTTGRFTVRFAWPTPKGRVVPTAAQSIVVLVKQGTTVTNSATLTPSSPTASFTEVPTGTVTVSATAYPAADGTGTPLASAQTTQTVSSGGNGSVDLTMASTIDHLGITPNPFNLALLGILTRQVNVTAYDSSNNVVLTSPSDLTYSVTSSNGVAVALILTNGAVTTVTGLALGDVTLTATDAISGKSASAPVHVTLN